MADSQGKDWKYLIVWEFRVRAGMAPKFEEIYSSNGEWAQLFRRSEEYIGTELCHDQQDRQRYTTLDFWTSRAAYEEFQKQYQDEYKTIDERCEDMTEDERKIGAFERI